MFSAEPSAIDLKGKAKWNAWNGKKGKEFPYIL